jgi:SAM-dependent methyltransferase
LGLAGKAVAQLSCNNARELISVKMAGAGRCVGFDISEAFIEQGQRLVAASGVDVELVRTNVYDIDDSHTQRFDLVYVTIGTLGWLPDVARFFALAARLLRPGGELLVYEMHAFLNLFDDLNLTPEAPNLARSYFDRGPSKYEGCNDYFDPTAVVTSPSYWFHHTLADIISALLKSGLALTAFEEYPHDLSGTFAALERAPMSLPLSYSLLAKK